MISLMLNCGVAPLLIILSRHWVGRMLVEQVGPRGICLLLSLDRFGEGANLLDDPLQITLLPCLRPSWLGLGSGVRGRVRVRVRVRPKVRVRVLPAPLLRG